MTEFNRDYIPEYETLKCDGGLYSWYYYSTSRMSKERLMFKVIQHLDCTGMPLDTPIIRTVYAADKQSDSFLIESCFGGFTWIPIWTCRPVKDSDWRVKNEL